MQHGRFFIFLFLLIGLTQAAMANMQFAPPSFQTADGKKAIFVDFKGANYNLAIDARAKTNMVTSLIEFNAFEEGFPVFLLVDNVISAKLDGEDVQTAVSEPYSGEKFRVVQRAVRPGNHRLEITHKISEINYLDDGNVLFETNVSDFQDDAALMEIYFPANFEADQFKMNVKIEITNAATEHFIQANGVVQSAANSWSVTLPEWYNSSSMFIFVGPKSDYTEASFTHESGIPVTVFITKSEESELASFVEGTQSTLSEYYRRFGLLHHDKVIIHASVNYGGGMEYAGATRTDRGALAHEIAHFYFARSVMPTNGDSGWIDEAMATRVSNNPPLRHPLSYYDTVCPGCKLGRNSPYIRGTNVRAYTLGASFLEHIANTYMNRNFEGFLVQLAATYKHSVVSNALFKREIETSARVEMTELFNKYVRNPLTTDDTALFELGPNPHKVNKDYIW